MEGNGDLCGEQMQRLTAAAQVRCAYGQLHELLCESLCHHLQPHSVGPYSQSGRYDQWDAGHEGILHTLVVRQCCLYVIDGGYVLSCAVDVHLARHEQGLGVELVLGCGFDLTGIDHGYKFFVLPCERTCQHFGLKCHQCRVPNQLLADALAQLVHRNDERTLLAADVLRQIERQLIQPLAVGKQVDALVLQTHMHLAGGCADEDIIVRYMRITYRDRQGDHPARVERIGEPDDGSQQHKRQVNQRILAMQECPEPTQLPT